MKEGRYCEKFIQKQDVVKAMGGKSDYENLVLAAMVHEKRMKNE